MLVLSPLQKCCLEQQQIESDRSLATGSLAVPYQQNTCTGILLKISKNSFPSVSARCTRRNSDFASSYRNHNSVISIRKTSHRFPARTLCVQLSALKCPWCICREITKSLARARANIEILIARVPVAAPKDLDCPCEFAIVM